MSITVDGITYTLPEDINLVAELPAGRYMLAQRTLRNSPADSRWESLIAQQRTRLGPGAAAAGVRPPNQRAMLWPRIQVIVDPHPDRLDKRRFGYWFNYFWAEAREAPDLSIGDKARLCDAFFTVFELVAQVAPVAQVRDDFEELSSERKLAVLTTLLVMGFKRVALDGLVPEPRASIGAGGVVQPVSRAVSARDLLVQTHAAPQVATAPALRAVPQTNVKIGFRGESRSYQEVVAASGLRARARSNDDPVYAACGLDQPWHPLGLDVYANSLFLRKGHNRDNCLFTVVSVAFEFDEVPAYPLLTPENFRHLSTVPLADWGPAEIADAARDGVRAVPPRAGGVDHLEHDQRVYVLRMDATRGFSTSQWQAQTGGQNPFPEIAIESVKTEDILGELTFTRHYFDRSVLDPPLPAPNKRKADFLLYSLDRYVFTLRPSEEVLQARFGAPFPAALRACMNGRWQSAVRFRQQAAADYRRARAPVVAAPPAAAVKRAVCPYCGKPFIALTMEIHKAQCSMRPR